MRCNAGSRYASVLPLPVCARATMSFPDSAALMHSTCGSSTLLCSCLFPCRNLCVGGGGGGPQGR